MSKPVIHPPLAAAAWPIVREWAALDDLCTGVFDCPHTTPQLTDDGPFVVRSQDVRSGVFRLEEAGRVSAATYMERIARAEPAFGDILYSREGTYFGNAAEVPAGVQVCLGQRMVLIKPRRAAVDSRFLTFWLNSPILKEHILGFRDGSVAERLNMPTIRNIPVPLVPMSEQTRVGEVLGVLNDKIELNRRMNDTVEGMAQAIFRDWFVGFGPVRRKLAGETDPVAIMGGLTPDPARAAELAALFPAELNDSGLPQGWIERPLDQIAEFLNGLALQKFPAVDGESSLPVIKIAELRNGLTEKSNRASPHLPNKYIVRDGDYLFSWSGSLMAKVWTEGDGALNQHLFKVSSTSYPQWFFGAWVEHHLPEFQQIAASKATTMGHIQRGHLTSAMTVCPPQPTLDVMATVLAPLWDRRIQNDLENRTLAETRDYLLPRLMSGEVRVTPSDTESAAA